MKDWTPEEILDDLKKIDAADARGEVKWISFEDEKKAMDKQIRELKQKRAKGERKTQKRFASAKI